SLAERSSLPARCSPSTTTSVVAGALGGSWVSARDASGATSGATSGSRSVAAGRDESTGGAAGAGSVTSTIGGSNATGSEMRAALFLSPRRAGSNTHCFTAAKAAASNAAPADCCTMADDTKPSASTVTSSTTTTRDCWTVSEG